MEKEEIGGERKEIRRGGRKKREDIEVEGEREKGKERDKRTMERGDEHYKTFQKSCFTHIKCSRSFISLGNDVLQDRTAHDHIVCEQHLPCVLKTYAGPDLSLPLSN